MALAFDQPGELVITCPKGVSDILTNELEELGYSRIITDVASVSMQGSLLDAIKLNLMLRTGHRVLYHLATFKSPDPEYLYRHIKSMEWEDIIPIDGYFSIEVRVENEHILDTRFAALRCKDGIADRFMEKFGKRPNSGKEQDHTVLFLYWKNNEASIYLDTSGDTISRHGYRIHPFKAPLKESLAAAIIMKTKWDRNSTFVNPMCGSGTLAIEAALIARKRYTTMMKGNFSFMHVLGYKEEYFDNQVKEVKRLEGKKLPFKIIASDIDERAIAVARKNAEAAGVVSLIEFHVCDFRETPVPEEGGGVVVMNPEYGERLGVEEALVGIYKSIGDFFKQKCRGYTGYVFTGNLDLGKQIGLKPSRRMEMFNGKIDCRLLEFELYSGSKRAPKEEQRDA